ncbi:MAG: DUF4037 domain-containing protein [Oscillospiraceae bacterium]|nr:DUF4037 domain-containing protein [Oscillospiraceae bacterium]
MKGLEEAKALYEAQGREMIRSLFPEYEGRIAAGLAGHGSECFGFDDALSRDHDFEPGFCLWLTDADDLAIGARLAHACRELFPPSVRERSAMGEKKLGVRRTSDFYRRYTGCSGAPETLEHWLSLPSWALAEATNGEVWRDDLGEFSAIRKTLLHGMPEDVRRKKIAARAAEMAQAGQYNYARCLAHGEPGAAQLALTEFVRSACSMVFLLNRAHAPYYKWIFRAMERLGKLAELKDALEFLLVGENDSALKEGVIEDICAQIIRELQHQQLSDSRSDYLEAHACEVQERIESRTLRAMHLMEG